jgi:hypothetical protein
MVLTSERVEKRPGATPAAFPPPIFAEMTSISVFRVSPPPHFVIVQGGSLYRRFKVKLSISRQRCTAAEAQGPNGLGWRGLV